MVRDVPESRDDWQRNVTIYPVGVNEKLEIIINLIGECDCEKPTSEVSLATGYILLNASPPCCNVC